MKEDILQMLNRRDQQMHIKTWVVPSIGFFRWSCTAGQLLPQEESKPAGGRAKLLFPEPSDTPCSQQPSVAAALKGRRS